MSMQIRHEGSSELFDPVYSDRATLAKSPICWCQFFLQHLSEFGLIAYQLTENEAGAEEIVLRALEHLSTTSFRPAELDFVRKQVWIAMLNESFKLAQRHVMERSDGTHDS